MKTSKEILQEYAEKLGFAHIVPICENPNFSEFYVCKTEDMMKHPNGKFGQSCVITLDKTGFPYKLNRDELTMLCKRIKES